MSGAVSTAFELMVPHRKLKVCIGYLESGLRSLKRTPYHRVLGKHFLGQVDELAAWLIDFHQKATAARLKPAAYYLEMNGFAVNTDGWHCHVFGYKRAGDVWDLEWLSEWDFEREEPFVLQGMESVREAFATLYLDEKQPLVS